MCRFTLYRGEPLRISSLVTEPDNSLIHQSFAARRREEPLNGDGFGLGWYVPARREPGRFRSITPAWNNRNLHSLAEVVFSTCILAHVRAASHGLEVIETNCHPFVHDRYAFMHNGEVGAFPRIRRALLDELSDESFDQIRGTTDTEHLFALFLDELRKEEPNHGCAALSTALGRAFERVLALVERHGGGAPSYLNVAVSDGEAAVVTRFSSGEPDDAETLFVTRGQRYECRDGVCRMVPDDDERGVVLVSSEPLTDDVRWREVPPNHVVSIHEDLGVDVREMEV